MKSALHLHLIRVARVAWRVALIALAVAAFAPQLRAQAPPPASVLVVSSHDTAAYAEAISGIRQTLDAGAIPLRRR